MSGAKSRKRSRKYKWKDGSLYEGEYSDGKFHGNGKLSYPSGSLYDGCFVNGQRSGKGHYTWPNGKTYDGDW